MSIGEYIRERGFEGTILENKIFEFWYAEARPLVADFRLNFYTLLIDAPLWRFNELYNAWYFSVPVEDSGPMGTFMESEVTDEQAREFLETRNVTFKREDGR